MLDKDIRNNQPNPERSQNQAGDEQVSASQETTEAGEQPFAASEEPFQQDEKTVTVSAQELESLREQAMQAAEFKDRWLRAAAEIENMRKRFARERDEIRKYAAETVLRHLLPVFDSLEMALQASDQQEHNNIDAIKQGLRMITQQLRSALEQLGVKEIDAEGKPFDHYYHEAVLSQETADVPEGHVIKQLRKGYLLHDRLIRPASVIVATRPQTHADAASEQTTEQPPTEPSDTSQAT